MPYERSYNKTFWVDRKTLVDAASMNNIEDGVEQNDIHIEELFGRDDLKSTEIANLKQKDIDLDKKIASEVKKLVNADTDINTRITAEGTRLDKVDTDTNTRITAEVTRLDEADSVANQKIDRFNTTTNQKIDKINTDLKAEITVLKNKDTSTDTEISTIKSNLTNHNHDTSYAPLGEFNEIKDKIAQNKPILINDDTPVGSVVFRKKGTTLPSSWLWCDGTALNKSNYPELFEVLGYTYGGSGNTFNLPFFVQDANLVIHSEDTSSNHNAKVVPQTQGAIKAKPLSPSTISMAQEIEIVKGGYASLDASLKATYTTKGELSTAKTELTNNINLMKTELTKEIDIVEKDLITSTSEELENIDKTSFKVGTGTSNSVIKDYSSKMVPSLVTLNNIEGKTVKQNGVLKNRYLKNIKILKVKNSSSNNLILGNLEYQGCSIADYPLGTHFSDIQDFSNGYRAVFKHTSPVEPNTKYIIKNFGNNTLKFAIYEFDENNCSVVEDKGWSTTVNEHSFTTSSKTYRVGIYVRSEPNKVLSRTELESAKITLAKGTSVSSYMTPKFEVTNEIRTNIELRSLPNGVKDEYINGVYRKRIGKIVLTKDNTNFQYGSTNGNTFAYSTPLTFNTYMENGESDFLNCDKFNQKSHANWANGQVGIHISANNKTVVVDVDKSTVDTLEDFKEKYLPITIEYALASEETYSEPLTMLANKGDNIDFDSPLPITCTHQVSLNTKSQIEETQNTVENNSKSILNIKKIINSLKFEFSFNTNGFLKFPDIFGGLLVQWGNIVFTTPVLDTGVMLPVAYKTRCLAEFASLQGRDSNFDGRVNFHVHNTQQGRLVVKNNVAGVENEVSWITIGY